MAEVYVPQSWAKLQEYAARTREGQSLAEIALPEDEYEGRINKTLQSLQNQVDQHKTALEKLRAAASGESINEPSQNLNVRLNQIRTITAGYRSLISTEPVLPSPASPLPALLALRTTLNSIDQFKKSINETNEKITRARARGQADLEKLEDGRALTAALERKIDKSQREYEEASKRTVEEQAHALIEEQCEKSQHYQRGTSRLVRAFNNFVSDQLAAMLAAEDLGGPVVGDLINPDEGTLEAGFTPTRKPKKARRTYNTDDVERQRRKNELWGSGERRSETEAAGAHFRSLTEDLLNAAADEDESDPYVNVQRESAAVRFLVRAKVAQYHPNDTRKLRLLEFGKELEQ